VRGFSASSGLHLRGLQGQPVGTEPRVSPGAVAYSAPAAQPCLGPHSRPTLSAAAGGHSHRLSGPAAALPDPWALCARVLHPQCVPCPGRLPRTVSTHDRREAGSGGSKVTRSGSVQAALTPGVLGGRRQSFQLRLPSRPPAQPTMGSRAKRKKLRQEGSVWAWGDPEGGQETCGSCVLAGRGDSTGRSPPAPVSALAVRRPARCPPCPEELREACRAGGRRVQRLEKEA